MRRLALTALFSCLITAVCYAQTISIDNLDLPGFFVVKAHGGDVSISNNVEVQQLIDGRWQHVEDVKLLACGKNSEELP